MKLDVMYKIKLSIKNNWKQKREMCSYFHQKMRINCLESNLIIFKNESNGIASLNLMLSKAFRVANAQLF